MRTFVHFVERVTAWIDSDPIRRESLVRGLSDKELTQGVVEAAFHIVEKGWEDEDFLMYGTREFNADTLTLEMLMYWMVYFHSAITISRHKPASGMN